MPQFFINSNNITSGNVLITGSDSYHLSRVRRVKPGSKILLRTENGTGYIALINVVTEEGINASIVSELKQDNQIPEITLYMALLKSGNFEFVIQKAVELGVSRIVPVITERTVPDPDKMNEKKLQRWEKISAEAGKQCMRAYPVFMESVATFKEVLSEDSSGLKIICHPGGDILIRNALEPASDKKSISILIGPEGGFSDREILDAQAAGWLSVNLGVTHLRAETAAIIIPSIVIYAWS